MGALPIGIIVIIRECPLRVFYKQALQLCSYVYAFMLVYKRRATGTPYHYQEFIIYLEIVQTFVQVIFGFSRCIQWFKLEQLKVPQTHLHGRHTVVNICFQRVHRIHVIPALWLCACFLNGGGVGVV